MFGIRRNMLPGLSPYYDYKLFVSRVEICVSFIELEWLVWWFVDRRNRTPTRINTQCFHGIDRTTSCRTKSYSWFSENSTTTF